jgi:hypothetical protein
VRQSGAPKCLSPQKTRGPKKSTQTFSILFPVLVFQRGAPKSARSPENVIGPKNLKMEAPNDFFVPCFSAGSKQRGALKSPRPPKAKPQTKKTARPHSLKRRGGSKSRPANTTFFVPSLGKELQKVIARPEIHRVQKISKFAANCYILKDR